MGRKSKNGTQLERVLEYIIKQECISWPIISRKLQIGYLRTIQVIEQLESAGYIRKMDEPNKYKVIRHTLIN